MMTDILTSIRGLSFSLPDLYQRVSEQGWEVTKVKYDKRRDRFVAEAKASHGQKLEAWGPSERVAVSNLVMRITHVNGMRSSKISMWTHTFADQLAEIAEAYSKAPLYEPKAAAAFIELGRDSERRADALREHLEILITNNPEPYTSPEKMCEDIRKRRRLEVSRTGIEHPLWSESQALSYRIVHDVLGYCAAGSGWDWEGENQAFATHAAILPWEAQKALFVESIAASAYATYYRAYGPAKVCLLPDFMDAAQEQENPHKNYHGVHPSQSFPPIERPAVKPLATSSSTVGEDPLGALKRLQKGAHGFTGAPVDPNDSWQSEYSENPLPVNAYNDFRDGQGFDPLQEPLVRDTAKLIDTEWAYLNQDDSADLDRMKRAIVNAFRVVLLSPKKPLRFNAVHYQDIDHIPPDQSDPLTFDLALDRARMRWNFKRYGEKAHEEYQPLAQVRKQIESLFYQRNPEAGPQAASEATDRFIYQLKARVGRKLELRDADTPEDNQQDLYADDMEVQQELMKALKQYLKPSSGETVDHYGAKTMPTPPPERTEPEAPDMQKYMPWMGSQINPIAAIGEHVDAILKAALYDVHERNGEGWHFRANVLALHLPNVGPKVCSFAWLMLQPMTSELATIDTHIMNWLGRDQGKDMNNRDYFKFEREFKAGRDASGYSHMPLGQFQWGCWDYGRSGPGIHQDHSGLRALDWTPHSDIEWQPTQYLRGQKGDKWLAPDWWALTQEARDAAGQDFDQTIAPGVSKKEYPFNMGAPPQTYAPASRDPDDPERLGKTADAAFNAVLTPFFYHPQTGQQQWGTPGQTLMNHIRAQTGLSIEQIWAMYADEAVGKQPQPSSA